MKESIIFYWSMFVYQEDVTIIQTKTLQKVELLCILPKSKKHSCCND